MLTFTGQVGLAQSLASDNNSDNSTLFKNLINIGIHKIEKKLDIYVTLKQHTFTTVTDALDATNQSYQLPRGFVDLDDLYVIVGTTQYHIVNLIEDPTWWGNLTANTSQSTSDYLQYARIIERKLLLNPIPASANTAYLNFYGTNKDLSQDDYITGSIVTLANDGVAVVGSGTTWTSQMIGRLFKVNNDGEWHFIKAVADTTHLTLETPYQGAAIVAGTDSYTIGEVCNLPEDIQDLPVTYALWQFFSFYHRDKYLATMYKNDYKDGIVEATADYSSSGSGQIITNNQNGNSFSVNPNLYPKPLT